MRKYLPSEIEKKWQAKWKKDKTFSPNLDTAKKPYYSLMMFPYPSAEGLHVGNMYAFTGSDIFPVLCGCRDMTFLSQWVWTDLVFIARTMR